MNKNLLMISYYFPPSGGPGVQRVLKNVKYLKDFGWNPIVLTVSNGTYPAIDESLFEQIPTGTPVYRTHIFEPYDLYRKFTGKKKDQAIDVNNIKKEDQKSDFKEKIAEFIRATFFIPDARIGWYNSAVKEIEQIIKDHDIHAIYSSSPPYTCSLIGNAAKKRLGKPWVASFRDPWTEFLTTPNRWFIPSKIDRYLEHKVYKNADIIEYAWEGIKKDMIGKYNDLDNDKFLHVPNGYDSDDFPTVEYTPNEKLTITYTGSLYGRRNPDALFTAIENLIEKGKVDKDKIRFIFVGRFGEEVNQMFEKASFSNSIETISYVPHETSIEYLYKSELLLLIVDESKESHEIVPGKVYEYIGTKKPVFAIAPQESAIADLIRETSAGKVAHQSEIEKIESIFLEYYNSFFAGEISHNPNHKAIERYERRNAAKTLAENLDRLVNT